MSSELAEHIFNAFHERVPPTLRPLWRNLSDIERAPWMAAAEKARLFILSDTHEIQLVTHEAIVVHALLSGVALCGFGSPPEWPAGHKWVAADAPLQGVNCEGCLRAQGNRG